MKWLIAILIFSLLVLIHEFGHFLVAKLCGVDVEEFSLGFGPRLLSTVKGGTRYSLKILLFGGSCRMKSTWADVEDDDDWDKPRQPEEGSFESVSVGKRIAILFAGPLFNFLLALVGSVILVSVLGYYSPVVTGVTKDSHAAEAGLEDGDIITSYQGSAVVIGDDISTWEVLHGAYTSDSMIALKVVRDGETLAISFRPDTIVRYMLGITYANSSSSCEITAVSDGSPMKKAGAVAGDTITAVNGTAIKSGSELYNYFQESPLDGSEVSVSVRHSDGTRDTYQITPVENDTISTGFSYGKYQKADALAVLKYGSYEVIYWIKTTVKSVAGLFTGRFSVNDLSGPVGVVDAVSSTYEEAKSYGTLITWMSMINLVILLSANLGVMNLLPIPALDGGRILFLLIEAVRGKPVSKKTETAVESVTAVLLLALMVYVMYHDIVTFNKRF